MYDILLKPSLWKNILKSMSTMKFIKKQLNNKSATPVGYVHLYVVLAALRKDKYPSNSEKFDDFKKNIILPCIELCNTSKFEFEDERWLSTTYEESLAGCKFHLPYKASVESRLSRHGNVRRKIFLCLYYLL
jgi:hypothetical protein